MKLPAVLPEGFLRALPLEERKRLGRAGLTSEEAQARYVADQEKKLQRDIATWLNREQIYFESDRMDRKTSGRKGRADFRVCVEGQWLSLEAKSETGKLTKEQAAEAARLRKSGGKFVVCSSLKSAIDAIRSMQVPLGIHIKRQSPTS
jgi:hypothetical protein